jgi:hypothetical protein
MPPIYNFFSIHDYALQFIHNNYEEQQAALGCAAARGNKDFEISNIDVSNMVTRHNDYKYKLTELYSLFLKKQ